MSETKHTPGPWHFNEENGRVSDQHDNPVAYISGRARAFGKETLTTACFNGRLIAAAPELLKALKMLLDRTSSPITDHEFYTIEDARRESEAAIRKAKGE